MFRWCKYERVGWRFWFAPHVFFWILCVREYRNCWQFRCNSSRKLRICLTTSPATPSKQCWRCRVALSLVLDLGISSAWWRGGSAVRIPNSCSGWQCAVLVRNTTLHRRGSGEVGHMPSHTIVTTWASPDVMISQKGYYPTMIVIKYHMAGPIRTSMWFRELTWFGRRGSPRNSEFDYVLHPRSGLEQASVSLWSASNASTLAS